MKYVDEYRDGPTAEALLSRIRAAATQRWTLMEVCGGQTHGLLKYGIPDALHDVVELIHGPGCPVCVTSAATIDAAQQLARQPGVIVASFGDMLRVPGSTQSLTQVRAAGGDVRVVYSPVDAVRIAQQHPHHEVVFLAVGFETTTPATALAVLQARALNVRNFSMLVSHVRVQPAMEMILADPDCRVAAFLAAGHVCTVTGYQSYATLVERFRTPVVVTGFEPVDLLQGILACVRQLETNTAQLTNCYPRAVSGEGNTAAAKLIEEVYEVVDRDWRGLGVIPNGGFRLRRELEQFDADRRFADVVQQTSCGSAAATDSRCRAGDVLSGRIQPHACEEFGKGCTPDAPLGAPMVSSEGACSAWFRYVRRTGLPQHQAGIERTT